MVAVMLTTFFSRGALWRGRVQELPTFAALGVKIRWLYGSRAVKTRAFAAVHDQLGGNAVFSA